MICTFITSTQSKIGFHQKWADLCNEQVLITAPFKGHNCFNHNAPVVQKVDSAVHWINHYQVDNATGLRTTYPLESNLSGGQRCPIFEQPGQVVYSVSTHPVVNSYMPFK